jgi:hypothetical protein
VSASPDDDDDDDDDDDNNGAPHGSNEVVSFKSSNMRNGASSGAAATAGGLKIEDFKRQTERGANNRIAGDRSCINRNRTLMKIAIVVVLTIVYFAISYQYEFAAISQRLSTAANQVCLSVITITLSGVLLKQI